ncbi:MAG: YdcF family protein [Oscillospiraceae bacterium]|nr:YdcF family protein [Oscillospiraceae bacterium]
MPSDTRFSAVLRRMHIAMIVSAVLLLVALVLSVECSAGHLVMTIPYQTPPAGFVSENENIIIEEIPGNDRQVLVTAKSPGICFVEGDDNSVLSFLVLPNGTIIDRSRFVFSGYLPLFFSLQGFVLVMTILVYAAFFLRIRHELYSYSTLFAGGTAIFLTAVAVFLLATAVTLCNQSDENAVFYVYDLITGAGVIFLGISAPFLLLFALVLTISNLVLIKREGFSIGRIPGLLISFLIFAGIGGYLILTNFFFSGSEKQMRIYYAIENTYALLFAYLESMLVGACICGMIAARRKPAPDKTHVVILGCRVGDDGKPLPLLRGRIDAAVALAKKQEAETGTAVTFVPSGGKGSDEVISEAGCMRNYLLEQGIPESRILVEDKSTSTLENMRFSLMKIREDCEAPKVAFATSNYHVLRSGIIARSAGLDAEGVGSRTGWYFWPNAFIREFIGLIVSKWKSHLLLLGLFVILCFTANLIFPR